MPMVTPLPPEGDTSWYDWATEIHGDVDGIVPLSVGATPPVSPSVGDLWADTSAEWLPVDSVNGQTGAVSLAAADVGAIATGAIGVTVQAYSAVLDATTASYTTALDTKLGGIEALADVTDATNVAAAGAVMKTLVDAKGDLLVGSAADTLVRLPVGVTNGHVLTVDSAEASGLKWAAAAGGGSQTPWTSDIDAAGYSLDDLNVLNMSGVAIPTAVTRLNVAGVGTGAATGNKYTAQFGAPAIEHGTTVGEAAALHVGQFPSRNQAGTTTVCAAFNVNAFPGIDDAAGSVNTEAIAFRGKMGGAGIPPTTMIGFQAELTGGFTSVATAVGVDIKSSTGVGTLTNVIGLRILNLAYGTNKWGMQVGDYKSYHTGQLRLGSSGAATYGLELNNTAANRSVLFLYPTTADPTTPAVADFGAGIYVRGDKLIVMYNDAGTTRYKYLTLSTTSVTWTHTTTSPT